MSVCAWCEKVYTAKRSTSIFCCDLCRKNSFMRQGSVKARGAGLTKLGRVVKIDRGMVIIQPVLPIEGLGK